MSQATWPGASGTSVDVSDGVVTATTHVGALTGNADTATGAAGTLAATPFYTAAAQVVDMAGATKALVVGTAGTGQVSLTGNTVIIDANGSGGGTSGQNLKLPATAGLPSGKTMRLKLANIGGEDITLQTSAAGSTGITLAAGETRDVEYIAAGSLGWVSVNKSAG